MTQKKKGPAEGATSPSHGSTNPAKEMDMNTHTDSTAAAGAQIETSDPLLPRGKTEIATSIDTAALRKCSMHELWLLHSALQTITDVICGFRWSPHFTDGAGNDVLDKINSFMCCYSDAAVRAAKTAEPATQREVEWQSWVILDNEARGADDLHDFAVLAASAARDVAAAAYSETHGRKGGAA